MIRFDRSLNSEYKSVKRAANVIIIINLLVTILVFGGICFGAYSCYGWVSSGGAAEFAGEQSKKFEESKK